jgi:tetratricopeptide (TPR) repeat protein
MLAGFLIWSKTSELEIYFSTRQTEAEAWIEFISVEYEHDVQPDGSVRAGAQVYRSVEEAVEPFGLSRNATDAFADYCGNRYDYSDITREFGIHVNDNGTVTSTGRAYRSIDHFLDSVVRVHAAVGIRPIAIEDNARLKRIYSSRDENRATPRWLASAHRDLANLYESIGNVDSALRELRSCLALEIPSDERLSLLIDLARLLRTSGEPKQALTEYRRALKLCGPEYKCDLVHVYLADTYGELGNRRKALIHYRKALVSDPLPDEAEYISLRLRDLEQATV